MAKTYKVVQAQTYHVWVCRICRHEIRRDEGQTLSVEQGLKKIHRSTHRNSDTKNLFSIQQRKELPE